MSEDGRRFRDAQSTPDGGNVALCTPDVPPEGGFGLSPPSVNDWQFRIKQFMREAHGPIRAIDVENALAYPRKHAAMALWALENNCEIIRVSRGLYRSGTTEELDNYRRRTPISEGVDPKEVARLLRAASDAMRDALDSNDLAVRQAAEDWWRTQPEYSLAVAILRSRV